MENTKKHPLVSAVIPTFNRGWIVAEAVKSVLNQDYPNIEVVVVDDGSTDDTPKKLAALDASIVLLSQANQGVSAARNRGIRQSKGELIAFLDSDDLWKKTKISRQVDFFRENPRALVCQTEEVWLRNGKRVNPRLKHKKKSGLFFEASLHLCLVSPSAVMMKRALFDEKGFFDETLPACEDYDFWLRTLTDTPVHLIEEPGTVKRGGHADQLSGNHSLDKYRIQSISKILQRGGLSEENRKKAREVLKEKCRIYGNGCLKRGRFQEGGHFLRLAAAWGPAGTQTPPSFPNER